MCLYIIILWGLYFCVVTNTKTNCNSTSNKRLLSLFVMKLKICFYFWGLPSEEVHLTKHLQLRFYDSRIAYILYRKKSCGDHQDRTHAGILRWFLIQLALWHTDEYMYILIFNDKIKTQNNNFIFKIMLVLRTLTGNAEWMIYI